MLIYYYNRIDLRECDFRKYYYIGYRILTSNCGDVNEASLTDAFLPLS